MVFTPYRLYHKAAATRRLFFWLLFRPRKVWLAFLAARGERRRVHPWSRGVCEVKEEDGVPCTIQAHEQMVVKVGSGTFELKGAE